MRSPATLPAPAPAPAPSSAPVQQFRQSPNGRPLYLPLPSPPPLANTHHQDKTCRSDTCFQGRTARRNSPWTAGLCKGPSRYWQSKAFCRQERRFRCSASGSHCRRCRNSRNGNPPLCRRSARGCRSHRIQKRRRCTVRIRESPPNMQRLAREIVPRPSRLSVAPWCFSRWTSCGAPSRSSQESRPAPGVTCVVACRPFVMRVHTVAARHAWQFRRGPTPASRNLRNATSSSAKIRLKGSVAKVDRANLERTRSAQLPVTVPVFTRAAFAVAAAWAATASSSGRGQEQGAIVRYCRGSLAGTPWRRDPAP